MPFPALPLVLGALYGSDDLAKKTALTPMQALAAEYKARQRRPEYPDLRELLGSEAGRGQPGCQPPRNTTKKRPCLSFAAYADIMAEYIAAHPRD